MSTEEHIIPDFPNYAITIEGKVFNIKTGREMVLSPTMQGDLTVGLVYGGYQYRRSVKVLVAKAFVNGHSDIFNTPIQLDGDRYNLHANNIRWRPRWFAWQYRQQLSDPYPDWFFYGPILDIINNIRYKNIFEAAITNGSLCENVHRSIENDWKVFPTGEKYVYI